MVWLVDIFCVELTDNVWIKTIHKSKQNLSRVCTVVATVVWVERETIPTFLPCFFTPFLPFYVNVW